MEKISSTLANKITFFQKRLQSFLENDFYSNHEEQDQIRQQFEASHDETLVRGISHGLPEDHIDRAIVIFSRLSMFFESGVLLENNDGHWRAQASFHRGVTELIKNLSPLAPTNLSVIVGSQKNTPRNTALNIPNASLMSVFKTNSDALLKKMGLEHLDPDKKTSCLLINVTPDFTFLLFSTLPDLWLKDLTENVRRALINAFAD